MARYRLKSGVYLQRKDGKKVLYKAGDEFEEHPLRAQGFRDMLERLDEPEPDDPELPQPEVMERPVGKKMRHKGFGRYDVLDQAGEPLNDRPLTKEEAEEFISMVQGPTEVVEEEQEDAEPEPTPVAEEPVAEPNPVRTRRRTKPKTD